MANEPINDAGAPGQIALQEAPAEVAAEQVKEEAKAGLSLAEFRQSRIVDEVLPSGLAVRLKEVSILDLAAEGLIPKPLLQALEKGRGGTASIEFDRLPDIAEGVNVVTRACMVFPPVADEPDEEHVGINELPFSDKLWVFRWSNRGIEHLQNFRGGEEQSDSAASGGQ